jgi:hypothetical protein
MKRLNKDTYEKLWDACNKHWDQQLLESEQFDPQHENQVAFAHEVAEVHHDFQIMIQDWESLLERFLHGDEPELRRRQGGGGDDSELPGPITEQEKEQVRKIKSMMESVLSAYNDNSDKVEVDLGPAYG